VKKMIGVGVLIWDREERVTDRYGYVWLMAEGGNSLESIDDIYSVPLTKDLAGQRCRLVAHVIETRQSTHIGDIFSGVYPRTPNVGAEIILGIGILTFPVGQRVGLLPEDGRPDNWLDIRSLYDVHEQTVELWAEPV
jgi:hypothetical protein